MFWLGFAVGAACVLTINVAGTVAVAHFIKRSFSDPADDAAPKREDRP